VDNRDSIQAAKYVPVSHRVQISSVVLPSEVICLGEKLTTHLYLLSRSGIRGAVPLLR
jgi:hypothetical protein